LIIRNKTDFPTRQLREIIRFCRPQGVTDFVIEFRPDWPGNPHSGYAFSTQYELRRMLTGRTPVRLGNNRPPDVLVYLYSHPEEERIVEIIAHELRHLWQDSGRAQGGRRAALRYGKCLSNYERDADEWANAKVQAWRQR
jgi:hypothetical protein